MAENDAQLAAILYGIGALISTSETLGLEVRAQDGEIRFRDPVTGRTLLSHSEADAARRTAEARVAELEALLRSRRR